MARKRAETDTVISGGNAPFPKISKTDAVKAALEAGVEKPKLGIAYIKEKFGIDITNSQFSQYKTMGKKKANGAPAPSTNGKAHVAPLANGSVASSVEAIKALCEKLGVEEVVSIARLFGK